jgi:hypothetical protein
MKRFSWLVAVALILLVGMSVLAEPPKDAGWFDRNQPRYRPMIIDNNTRIDANNIEMIVTNHGSFAYDLTQQDAGLWFPRGTDKTCVYASGLWIGATINDEIYITAGSFTQEYTPGPIIGDCEWPDVGAEEHRVYKIYKGMDPEEDDYAEWPTEYGAPVDEFDNPLLIGDQTLWCVYNDADPDVHIADEGSADNDPMGIEVQQLTFAFDWAGALGNVVFTKFLVINKCDQTLEDTYFAVWCDPDVGAASDDYVGCDTTLSVGFAYNATNTDNLYAAQAPCVGYDFFKGPIGDDGKELPMTSFNMYINATDPRAKDESYNYMQGLDGDGDPVVNPLTGETTTFMFPGDPVANTGWLDSDPADRRFMLNTGPFTMEPGDTQEVVVGLVVGQGNDRIGSVRVMKFFDLTAQVAFDLDFDLPPPPDRPIVWVAELDREIQLSWGKVSEVDRAEGYTFQGYNVYQSASVSTAGPWKLIGVYDIIDGLQTIEDLTLNIEFGVPIVQPVQFGGDYGLGRHLEITEDKVKGEPLNNGTAYYYKVGAYSYNPTPEEGLPKTLEGFSSIITAIPQEPVPEAELTLDDLPEAEIDKLRHDTEIPPTTDRATVFVTNPYLLTGDEYQIGFREADPPRLIIVGEDTTIAYYEWNIKNTSTGDYLYVDPVDPNIESWQVNKSGDEEYEVFDGFLAKVLGSHVLELAEVTYVDATGARARALTAVDWGGLYAINGSGGPGADYGWNFFGSTLDPVADADQFTTLEVRFSTTETQKAYRYERGFESPYPYLDFVEVPFQVWDTVNNIQLNACFLENWDPPDNPTIDGTWGPDDSDLGGREYLWIMKSEYDPEGGLYDDENWGPGADVLYALWPRLRTGYEMADLEGGVLTFIWSQPATGNDYFQFTPSEVMYNNAKAKGVMDKIRAVPNPYFAKSAYELDQFDHVIKFSNLPRTCTVRVFNLAGDLVRMLEKTDETTSILEWNLLNEKEIPVASGFYIYHVDAPGIGSKYGKMAIFLEKERLNTF